MAYPDAPEDKLRCVSQSQMLSFTHFPINRVCIDYTCILFSYDDLLDIPGDDEETKYMRSARGAENAAQMLIEIFKKPEDFKPIDSLPVLTAFHE